MSPTKSHRGHAGAIPPSHAAAALNKASRPGVIQNLLKKTSRNVLLLRDVLMRTTSGKWFIPRTKSARRHIRLFATIRCREARIPTKLVK